MSKKARLGLSIMSIYLLSAPCHGPRKAKIGCTQNARKRRYDFGTSSCPEKEFDLDYHALWKVRVAPGLKLIDLERQVHTHFDAYRMKDVRQSEWFTFPGRRNIIDLVSDVIEAQPWFVERAPIPVRRSNTPPPQGLGPLVSGVDKVALDSPAHELSKHRSSSPTAPAAPTPPRSPKTPAATWESVVLTACQVEASQDPHGFFTRKALIASHLSDIVQKTGSKGKTPDMTLSRILQVLRDKGALRMISTGTYQIRP